MSLIANTDALIVDLRKNGGGDPQTVAWMTSYLVDERTHLNSFFFREGNKTEQFWTNDYVPGKKFGGKKPIYVLTAKRTFSGAEEFSYNMKALKRGVIVGETTGGGAHPGESIRLTAHFTMFVPNARAINPITKTNWEGVGVEPDVKVAADDALRIAQILALEKILVTEQNTSRAALIRARKTELESAASR
jgi:C-terminal processing protease CtpA/Prc